jgi:branched-chain amino acid transport system permease protein
MGAIVGLKGFTASVLGGRGMISGGVVGGLVLGIVESLGTMIFSAQYRDSISFTILILILLFKPEGLLGKRSAK